MVECSECNFECPHCDAVGVPGQCGAGVGWHRASRRAPARPTHMTILCHLSFWGATKKKDESCRRHEALSPIPAASGQTRCAGRAGHCPQRSDPTYAGAPSAKVKEGMRNQSFVQVHRSLNQLLRLFSLAMSCGATSLPAGWAWLAWSLSFGWCMRIKCSLGS